MSNVVYSSPYVPPEWILAHGLTPHRTAPLSHKCDGPIPDTEGVCPFMRSFVNETVANDDVSALVLTTTCDQMRRAFDLVVAENTVPTFLMDIPATWQSSRPRDRYISELVRLGNFLVSIGGTSPADGVLERIMLENGDPTLHMPIEADGPSDGVPIALVGGPITIQDNKIIDIIHKAGGRVVLNGLEGGDRTLRASFDESRTEENALQELASSYFDTIPEAFCKPNSRLYEWLASALTSSDARGVIVVRYVWCDIWHAEVNRIKESLKIPALDIDLNGDCPISRNSTRIQAFMEALI